MGLHTDIPSRRQIERLLRAGGDNLVSIYLPTSPITPEADAARIAFKNLASVAASELRASSSDAAEREAVPRRRSCGIRSEVPGPTALPLRAETLGGDPVVAVGAVDAVAATGWAAPRGRS